MASAQEIKIQDLICEPEKGKGALDGAPARHQAAPDADLSEQEEIAQLTRSIQSIVNADKRISDLLNSDPKNEHKPTLWLR